VCSYVMFYCLYCFYVFVLNVLSCITVLYCIDVRLSHLSKDYLLTYVFCEVFCSDCFPVYSLPACHATLVFFEYVNVFVIVSSYYTV